jgi:bifunctional DNA-binding transcriptional regulator/antitoxin component of YhaV-PrlF toxin-antitoxin module
MNSWTLTVEEAEDGSGDLVLPLPQELLNAVGWKETDTLEWIDNGNGSWAIQKVQNEEDLLRESRT